MSGAPRPIQEAYRDTARGPRPPVRIAHLGLGAFHRAHQAWYTAHASDAEEWGIAAFAGRSAELADRLSRQDGLYTLVQRSTDTDRYEIVDSIVRAHAGADVSAFVDAVASPRTALVTLTITEAGYTDSGDRSPLQRLLAGLAARRSAGGGGLAIVSCDNLPSSGMATRDAVLQAAQDRPDLAAWIEDAVSFVSTSVDRITPHAGPGDIDAIERLTGWQDAAPVITEPFTDWVLSGAFPAGRPDWESAGARFVADVEPWERRKLWLLNGAHTILAAEGTLRGHETVAQAISDPACADVIERFWDEASRHLPDFGLAAYRRDLRSRFANPRIEHRLAQIAQDAATKAGLRLAPVVLAERRAGRRAPAAVRGIAAVVAVERGATGGSVPDMLHAIHPDLASDQVVFDDVTSALTDLTPKGWATA